MSPRSRLYDRGMTRGEVITNLGKGSCDLIELTSRE